MSDRLFGALPNIPVGMPFKNRAEVRAANVHLPLQAGTSGTAKEGAESIVVNGGYIDDRDYGDEIIYTGAGGQENGKQLLTKRSRTRTTRVLSRAGSTVYRFA